MSGYRTQDEVRNYDILKGIILLLLVGAAAVSIAFGVSDSGEAVEEPAGSDVSEVAEVDEGTAEEAAATEFAAPELLSPAPGEELAPGPQTFSGIGNPGSEVVVGAGGEEIGQTTVAEDGTWQLEAEVPPDAESIELQEVDENGNVVASSPAIPMTTTEGGTSTDGSTSAEGGEEGSAAEAGEEGSAADSGEEGAEADSGEEGAEADSGEEGAAAESGEEGAEAESGEEGSAADSGEEGTAAESGEEEAGEEFTVDPVPTGVRSGTITVSGTGEPGSDVAIDVGGEQAATSTVNIDGTWSIQVDAGEDAAEVTVRAITAEGETIESASAGEIAPTTIVAPIIHKPAGIMRAGVMTLTGVAVPGTTVELTANGVAIGTISAGEDGTWSLDVTLPEGEWDVDAVEVDENGVVVQEALNVSVTVVKVPEGEAIAVGETDTPEEEPVESEAEQPAESEEETPEDLAGAIGLVEDADTVVEAIEGSGNFTSLLSGIEKAGLEQSLDEVDESYTLFAPTDEAFEAIPEALILGWDSNPEEYRNIMRYLAVEGKYLPDDLTDGLVLQTVAGTNVGITHTGNLIQFSGVPVIDYAEVGNSVVYAVPKLILPPLPAGVIPPIIDVSGVPVFTGPTLTVVGVAQPGARILVTVDGENFGKIALVAEDGRWEVVDDVESAVRRILAYMIDERGLLTAISQEVELAVPE